MLKSNQPVAGRAMRADAKRNRDRVLEVAYRAFAEEGLSVPVQEIARRAGVGTGTVSRHFPTKESLFEAIILSRVERLVNEARDLQRHRDPGDAFFEFFAVMVGASAADRGLADALAGVGFDVEGVAAGSGHDVVGVLGQMLGDAQRAGAVVEGIDVGDVKSLIMACGTRWRGTTDGEAGHRIVAVVCDGLRA